MKKYNVELVPTIILIDSKGKIVDRIEGAIPQAQMDKKLQDLK
jgi:thioredoxin-related protein